MNTEEVVADDMDPVSVLEARLQEQKDKLVEVPAMVDTFIEEVSGMHPLLREWDYPAMEHVSKMPLNVFVDVVEEPLPNADNAKTTVPWYRRLLKKAPTPVKVAVMRKEVTRKVAAWEVASVNADKSGVYIEIYVDVKTGAVYYKSLYQPLAYELRPDHLIDCSYRDMTRLLGELRSKSRSIAWDIQNSESVKESSARFEQMQSDALEDVRKRLGANDPSDEAAEAKAMESHS